MLPHLTPLLLPGDAVKADDWLLLLAAAAAQAEEDEEQQQPQQQQQSDQDADDDTGKDVVHLLLQRAACLAWLSQLQAGDLCILMCWVLAG